MKYDELLKEAEQNNLKLYEINMDSGVKGLCIGDKIILNKSIDSRCELSCILAEEIGHYKTTVGDITGGGTDSARQELRARIYAYDRLIGLEGLVAAREAGCTSINETAEYLCVTEKFLCDAIRYYEGKYGVSAVYKDKIIYFIPSLKIESRQL